MATTTTNPERWARFLDSQAPGLTWLAGTLLEWGELPPLARRAWSVTASTTRGGDVNALAAFHEESGLLAVAGTKEAQPPFYGDPSGVKRLLGLPDAVESVFRDSPMLTVRRMPGFSRQVLTFDSEDAIPHPMLRRARLDEWQALEHFRLESDVEHNPEELVELAGPVQRGLVYALEGEDGLAGMFRVEGISRQRVQFADTFVHPRYRGRGLGAALLRSAAHVARSEYARGAVLTLAHTEAGEKTGARAGFTAVGFMDDIRLS